MELDCILGWYFSSTLLVSKILAWILELFQMRWCDNKKKILPRLSCLPLISARLPLLPYCRGKAEKLMLFVWGFLREDDFHGCCVRKLLDCCQKESTAQKQQEKVHLRKSSTGLGMRTWIFLLQNVFVLPPLLLMPRRRPMTPVPILSINHPPALVSSNCVLRKTTLWFLIP